MDSFSPFPQSQDDSQFTQPPPSQISLPPPPSVDPGDYQYLHLPPSHHHHHHLSLTSQNAASRSAAPQAMSLSAATPGAVGVAGSGQGSSRNNLRFQAAANATNQQQQQPNRPFSLLTFQQNQHQALMASMFNRHPNRAVGVPQQPQQRPVPGHNPQTSSSSSRSGSIISHRGGGAGAGGGIIINDESRASQRMNSSGGSSSLSAGGDNSGSSRSEQANITHLSPAQEIDSVPEPTELLRPNLQNIVSTVNLGCALDLKKIALQARNAEFNPKRFAAVIMRIRQPRTTALIFSSGKMVCTGAKSEEESRLAARKYARIVQKIGFSARFIDFKIQNMVGSVDVQFPIRLEGLVLQHEQFCSYEPELFPGLIYRMIKPKIVLLIFVSGKVVLTGAKVRREIYEAFDNIYPILRGFRKLS